MTRAMVTLIKKVSDKRAVSKLSPITLLNTELKDLAKVSAKRLAHVLSELVREA